MSFCGLVQSLFKIKRCQIERKSAFYAALGGFLFFCNVTYAYDWESKAAEKYVSELVQVSTQKNPSVDAIRSVLKGYSQLNRSEIPESDLLELRFLLQHWRKSQATRQIQELNAGASASSYSEILQKLDLLHLKADRSTLGTIFSHRPEQLDPALMDAERDLVVHQGDSSLSYTLGKENFSAGQFLESGPKTRFEIKPFKLSLVKFKAWKANPDQRRYKIENDEVYYRGLRLRTGDVLLTEINDAVSAMFSAVSGAKTFLPHFSLFVLYESKKGWKLPIVLDIYGFGLRVVPLNSYFGELISSYVEVYRLQKTPEHFETRLNQLTKQLLKGKKGKFIYDLSGASSSGVLTRGSKHFATCSGLGQFVFKELGISEVAPRCQADLEVVDSLQDLNVSSFKEYLSPQDFSKDPRFVQIGMVDNNALDSDIAKQLVAHRLTEHLRHHRIDFSRLPPEYTQLFNKLKKVKNPGFLIRLVLWLSGYRGLVTVPHGSPENSAFTVVLGESLRPIVKNLADRIAKKIQTQEFFSIHDFQEDEEMKKLTDEELASIRGWFTRKP